MENTRPWYKKKRYLFSIGAVVLLIIAGSGGSKTPTTSPIDNQALTATAMNAMSTPEATTSLPEAKIPETTTITSPVVKVPEKSVNVVQPKIEVPVPIPAKAQTTTQCSSNYSGCVPIASDVDCAGGSGNGPEYVRGPVRVIGYDEYGLDRDGNGIGCE